MAGFFSGVTFVLFCFVFRFVEAAALRSIVLRYAGVPIATHVSLFLFLIIFFLSLFPRFFFWYHFRFLFVWRVRRTFFPFGWYFFYLVTTGWIFDISLLCENSINQSINQSNQSLPSCLWSQRILPSLPGSRLTIFDRDASSANLQLVNQWLNFTYSGSHAFRYERKNTNPTLVIIELTTSALAGGVQLTY